MTDLSLDKPKVLRSPLWPRVQRAHLAQYATCAACGAREHLQVHHKVPVHVDPTRELDPANLVTLCEGPSKCCHLLFGHLGSWYSWNTQVIRDAKRFLARVLTRPHLAPSPQPPAPAR